MLHTDFLKDIKRYPHTALKEVITELIERGKSDREIIRVCNGFIIVVRDENKTKSFK